MQRLMQRLSGSLRREHRTPNIGRSVSSGRCPSWKILLVVERLVRLLASYIHKVAGLPMTCLGVVLLEMLHMHRSEHFIGFLIQTMIFIAYLSLTLLEHVCC